MTAELHPMAGFGWPPGVYNQNANERLSSILENNRQEKGSSLFQSSCGF